MRNIDFEVGDNLGGNEILWLADIEDVDWDNFPEASDNLITDNVILLEGKEWYYMKFILETLSYSEDEEINKTGFYYKQRLSGTIPKSNPDLSISIAELRNRRFILCVKDNNGYFKLIGNRENYMQVSRSFDSENNTTGRNSYKIKFEGTTLEESAFYTGDFSGEFNNGIGAMIIESTFIVG